MSKKADKIVTPDGEVLNAEPKVDGFKLPFFKTPYNHDTDAEALSGALFCQDPTLAQQHTKDEADINVIVERFGVTGKLPTVPLPPQLAEFDDVFDFQSAMNTIAAAKASFMGLDAKVREAFNHDPHKFVAWTDQVLNDDNKERRERSLATMRAMGLAVEPGPIADKTSLGDVLAAIKEQGTPRGESSAPKP